MTSQVIAYRSLELLFGTHAFHFNCFFEDFNCVFTQIRCLSRVLNISHANRNRRSWTGRSDLGDELNWRLYPPKMYTRGMSMTIVNCTKAVKLIYSFIVSIQKLTIPFDDYSLNSNFFPVQNSISAMFLTWDHKFLWHSKFATLQKYVGQHSPSHVITVCFFK